MQLLGLEELLLAAEDRDTVFALCIMALFAIYVFDIILQHTIALCVIALNTLQT